MRIPPHLQRRRGFSLVELAVVVTLIGLLASLALPILERVIQRVRVNATANDLRVFSTAFKLYAAEQATWPPTQADAASLPAGMQGYISQTSWLKRTPIGGSYSWTRGLDVRGEPHGAVISIHSSEGNPIIVNYEQLVELDTLVDDGNLLAGSLRVGAYPDLVYFLE